MRYALPLWHCLKPESKKALVEALKKQGETEFAEPHPVWEEWPTKSLTIIVTPLPLRDKQAAKDYYDKFMKQRPHPSPESRK